jgi:Protein of unknown function (DUF2442)/Domain of unknown function (DUF4160)
MPALFWERGFKFHFYSNEGDPGEPLHVHVAKRRVGDAKLWLYPEVAFAYTHGFDAQTQSWIVGLIEAVRRRLRARGMSISVQATKAEFEGEQMWVHLDDGRVVGVPLARYPRLLHGSADERAQMWITPSGLHWDELDEDMSIVGILAGRGDLTRARSRAA